MLPSTRPLLSRGRALFNSGAFFEAHEVWEEAWLAESGELRRILQGLIQIAAALYKASRSESPRGCVRLFDEGLSRLEGAADEEPGLALERFRADVRRVRDDAARWESGETGPLSPESFPKLRRLISDD